MVAFYSAYVSGRQRLCMFHPFAGFSGALGPVIFPVVYSFFYFIKRPALYNLDAQEKANAFGPFVVTQVDRVTLPGLRVGNSKKTDRAFVSRMPAQAYPGVSGPGVVVMQ